MGALKYIEQEAVMIGDRLDNDISPAKRLGMQTIWIRQGFEAKRGPRKIYENLGFSVYCEVEKRVVMRKKLR